MPVPFLNRFTSLTLPVASTAFFTALTCTTPALVVTATPLVPPQVSLTQPAPAPTALPVYGSLEAPRYDGGGGDNGSDGGDDGSAGGEGGSGEGAEE